MHAGACRAIVGSAGVAIIGARGFGIQRVVYTASAGAVVLCTFIIVITIGAGVDAISAFMANIVGAQVAIIGAGRTDAYRIIMADARIAVAPVGGTFVVVSANNELRMGTNAVNANICGAQVAVVGTFPFLHIRMHAVAH